MEKKRRIIAGRDEEDGWSVGEGGDRKGHMEGAESINMAALSSLIFSPVPDSEVGSQGLVGI